jgi:hypothetical protein
MWPQLSDKGDLLHTKRKVIVFHNSTYVYAASHYVCVHRHLGTAFSYVCTNQRLYPTVGVDANCEVRDSVARHEPLNDLLPRRLTSTSDFNPLRLHCGTLRWTLTGHADLSEPYVHWTVHTALALHCPYCTDVVRLLLRVYI